MPRDGSGIFTKPFGDVTAGATIESAVHNGIVADFTTDANAARPIIAGGTGATNIAEARDNLNAEVAMAQVINYDTHTWENGSFYSNAGSTGGPNDLHAFAGTAQVYTPDYITLQARDVFDTTSVPGRAYVREKKAGVWGSWTASNVGIVGGITGIGSDTADMYFGLTGTSPTSYFVVNSESDASGTNLLAVGKNGVALFQSIVGSTTVTMNATAGSYNQLYFSNQNVPRFLFRNDGNTLFTYTFDDAGAPLATAMAVHRTSGAVTIGGNLVLNSDLYCSNTHVRYSTGAMASVTPNPKLVIESNAVGDAAYMAFARSGIFAGALGIDTDNALKYGGFNLGANAYRVAHEGLTSINFAGTVLATGDAYVRSAVAGNARVIFQDEVAGFRGQLTWDRADVFLATATGNEVRLKNNSDIALTGAKVFLANGFVGRAGNAGAYGTNVLNFSWSSPALSAYVDALNIGTINITSDYRIKKDVTDLPGMWDTVKALRPIKYTQAEYTPPVEKERMLKEAARREQGAQGRPGEQYQPMFVADDIERWGFVAHELQETMLESAADGVKDAPDQVQSLNLAPVVAALTRALQEAMERIEALEARAPP